MLSKKENRNGKVLVLGDDDRSFLTVIRSLGRKNICVHVGWCPSASFALHSKYIKKIHERMSPETKIAKDEKISKKKVQWWVTVDKKKKQEILDAVDKGRERFWRGEDPVKLALVKQHMSEAQQKRWDLISPEGLKNFCKKLYSGF